ncbi:HNH endonuclease signature motif containing protein [Phytoactinopolyspora mesophila]|uniref:DUF222 domain-containing protein n=1 Tax=Phytoactinopolyspora mesophila TaxID=2650750 RepID=A0A7K3M084_9ACTN|nr:HNH endonuclease signature motif containing protein [Phytoactinopolyspora mesophila]NDL56322.1 DUF222 domain-containing protein [Phytoactinopolyspora mesophila]
MSSEMLDGLTAAVREVAAEPAADLSEARISDELLALRRLADAAEAAYLTRLRVFDKRRISESTSALSTGAWVRHKSHVAPAETSRALKIARMLTDLPVVEHALINGEIRVPHAEAITRAAKLLGTDVIAGCQDALVAAASTDDPTRLRAALRGLGAAVDDTKAAKRAEKRDQGRWLDLSSTFDGAVILDGVLGEEDGAIVNTAIDALATPSGPDDQRTPSQRRADALVELCRRALAAGDVPSQGGEATHLIVVTNLDTLETRTGGLGELTNGAILRGDAVRRLACDARISRIITGPDSQPLDVGRSQRTATPAQRKALRLRDRGCVFPGCRRPPEWTEVHHLIPWIQGGRTNIDEMALLCRKHHTLVHQGGWTIQILGPGQFRFINPNGNPASSKPPPSTTDLLTDLIHTTRGSPPRAGPDNDVQTTGLDATVSGANTEGADAYGGNVSGGHTCGTDSGAVDDRNTTVDQSDTGKPDAA